MSVETSEMEIHNAKKKVAAFILRTNIQGSTELLVHSFADSPSLPRRVPGGGVYSEETPEQAVYREILEETGLAQVQLVRKLGVQHYYKAYIQADVERHDFLFGISATVPDIWEHRVGGKGADAGETFRYHWLRADQLDHIDEEHLRCLNPDYLPELFSGAYQNRRPTSIQRMRSADARARRTQTGGMMPKAILFDLDGTLLDNSMEVFAPPLLQAVADSFSRYVPAQRALSALLSSVEAMDANAGTLRSNKEVFVQVFCSATGIEPAELDHALDEFYARDFPRLASLTRCRPEARSLVAWTIQNAFQVVIATGMQAPRAAAEHRLAWAGVPVTDFAYTFITTWDNMHASKPHPAYFQELIANVGRQPAECLMVGDDWEHDILPATSIGIPSYWIEEPGQTSPTSSALIIGQGTLAELFAWLRQRQGEGKGGL